MAGFGGGGGFSPNAAPKAGFGAAPGTGGFGATGFGAAKPAFAGGFGAMPGAAMPGAGFGAAAGGGLAFSCEPAPAAGFGAAAGGFGAKPAAGGFGLGRRNISAAGAAVGGMGKLSGLPAAAPDWTIEQARHPRLSPPPPHTEES